MEKWPDAPFMFFLKTLLFMAVPFPEPMPQKNVGSEKDVQRRFAEAYETTLRQEFQLAYNLWTEFLTGSDSNAALDVAQYNLGLVCLFLGKPSEAVSSLRQILDRNSELNELTAFQQEVRLLYADALIEEGRAEQALAATYDILPSLNTETKFGVVRNKAAVGSTYQLPGFRRAKAYLIRARAFSSLDQTEDALRTLAMARSHLETLPKKNSDRARLEALTYKTELDVIFQACTRSFPHLTSADDLALIRFLSDYQTCTVYAPDRACKIARMSDRLTGADRFALTDAQDRYLQIVNHAFAGFDPLPPPTNSKLTESQKKFFEAEFTELLTRKEKEHWEKYSKSQGCKHMNLLPPFRSRFKP